jgi:hypothetical protein
MPKVVVRLAAQTWRDSPDEHGESREGVDADEHYLLDVTPAEFDRKFHIMEA